MQSLAQRLSFHAGLAGDVAAAMAGKRRPASSSSSSMTGLRTARSAQRRHRRSYASSSSSASPSTHTSAAQRYDVTPTTLVLALMPILTFGLGTWQIKRLNWKMNLIDELDEKLAKPPMSLPAKIDTAAIPEFVYRKVEVTGRFDHANEVLLGPRTKESVLGYSVVTPLVRDESDPSSTILVNRGHVSMTLKEQRSRPESLVEGTQHVVGMLRDQEKRNVFSPVNSPEKREFQFADIAQMASTTGSQPVLVDATFEGNAGEMKSMLTHGIPLGRPATIELRNQHATYAVTWYALSAATTVMLFRLFRKGPSKGNKFARFER